MNRRVVSISNLDFQVNLYVYKCTFINVSSPSNFGIIYFVALGDAKLKMVCAYQCHSFSNYNFGYILSSNNTGIISFDHLSVNKCPGYSIGNSYVLSTGNSLVSIQSLNLTQSHGISSHCLFLSSPYSAQMNFSTLTHNSINGNNYCFNFLSRQSSQIITQNTNFIHNSASSGVVVFANGDGNVIFNDCIFSNNQGTLFYVHSSTNGFLILLYCSIAHRLSGTGFSSAGGSGKFIASTDIGGSYLMNTFVFTEGSITRSYALSMLHTAACNADIPAFTPAPTNISLSDLCDQQTPPQSIPLSPTECFIPSKVNAADYSMRMLTVIGFSIIHFLI